MKKKQKKYLKLSFVFVAFVGLLISSNHSFAKYIESNYGGGNARVARLEHGQVTNNPSPLKQPDENADIEGGYHCFIASFKLNIYKSEIKEEIEREEEIEVVGSLCGGKNAIEVLEKVEDVDILIINLVLPNFDGLAILKCVSKMNKQKFKKIIATSFFATSDIMNVLRELNVMYL